MRHGFGGVLPITAVAAARTYVQTPDESRVTTVQMCGLWPFGAGSGSPMIGVPLGRHLLTNATLCCDPLSWFERGQLVLNPSVFVLGLPGLGKSPTPSTSCPGRATAPQDDSSPPLTVSLVKAAEHRATRSPGGRLPVPLVAVLGEAANICRFRNLDSYYSHFGSRGIVILTILQNWAQGEDVWAKAAWRNSGPPPTSRSTAAAAAATGSSAACPTSSAPTTGS